MVRRNPLRRSVNRLYDRAVKDGVISRAEADRRKAELTAQQDRIQAERSRGWQR